MRWGGAAGFEILLLLLQVFLGRERSIRIALGVAAALLFLVFGVTTLGSDYFRPRNFALQTLPVMVSMSFTRSVSADPVSRLAAPTISRSCEASYT
jgi:hypothetical protein